MERLASVGTEPERGCVPGSGSCGGEGGVSAPYEQHPGEQPARLQHVPAGSQGTHKPGQPTQGKAGLTGFEVIFSSLAHSSPSPALFFLTFMTSSPFSHLHFFSL